MARVKIDPSLVRRIIDDVNPTKLLASKYKDTPSGRVVQRMPRAVKVNRKVIESVKQLEAQGEIPTKVARRMIEAVKYQNTIDTAPMADRLLIDEGFKRANRRWQTSNAVMSATDRKKFNRPAIGKVTRVMVPTSSTPNMVEMRGNTYRWRKWNDSKEPDYVQRLTPKRRAELLSGAVGEVHTGKLKIGKPSKEQMLGMIRDSLAYSRLRQLNREIKITPASKGIIYDRAPSTKRDKVIASLAKEYRKLRDATDAGAMMPKRQFNDANTDVYFQDITPDDLFLR